LQNKSPKTKQAPGAKGVTLLKFAKAMIVGFATALVEAADLKSQVDVVPCRAGPMAPDVEPRRGMAICVRAS
jgi:hypothetical protein